MISAKDAYALAAPKLDEYRSFLDSRIREAAERGMASVTVREDPYNMWLYNETALEDMDAKRCIRELRELGYSLKQLYRSDSYFADVGLIIDWSKK
jgi:gp48